MAESLPMPIDSEMRQTLRRALEETVSAWNASGEPLGTIVFYWDEYGGGFGWCTETYQEAGWSSPADGSLDLSAADIFDHEQRAAVLKCVQEHVDALRADPRLTSGPVRPGARYVEHVWDEHEPVLDAFAGPVPATPLPPASQAVEVLLGLVDRAITELASSPIERITLSAAESGGVRCTCVKSAARGPDRQGIHDESDRKLVAAATAVDAQDRHVEAFFAALVERESFLNAPKRHLVTLDWIFVRDDFHAFVWESSKQHLRPLDEDRGELALLYGSLDEFEKRNDGSDASH